MKFVEKTGRTVDSAITDALIELGATTDQVDIQIIDKGSKGIFGLGAKAAKVRVTLKDTVAEKHLVDLEAELTVKSLEKVLEEPVSERIDIRNENIQDTVIIAEEFLRKVLKEMNVEATLETKQCEGNRIQIDISGENMGVIIGKRGETLDALQYLTNIAINKQHENYVKVMIDTENYRARREETLTRLAYKLAKKASQTRRPVVLEPMNPYDRRIIHSALQNSKTVKTHSEGKEPFRKVVITPNYQNKSSKE
ncbi:MAG: RNA-binding cell elongation regulator Jag/EloR [Cellulosilyticaceae bacterium]